MAEISLLSSAAAAASPPGILHLEHAIHELAKDFRSTLSLQRGKSRSKSSSLQFNSQHLEGNGGLMHFISGYGQPFWPSLMAEKSMFVDAQEDSYPDFRLSSFGIYCKSIRHHKILETLISGLKSLKRCGLDLSLFSDLMRLYTMDAGMWTQQLLLEEEKCFLHGSDINDSSDFLHLEKQLYIPESSLEFVRNTFPTSPITIKPDDQVLFTGRGAEIKDLFSVLENFSISRRPIIGSKRSFLVPYFTRKGRRPSKLNNQISSSKLQTQKVSPSNSPDGVELNRQNKKKQKKKSGKDQGLYQRNYLHACEKLLSVVLNNNINSMAIHPLKKSGTEIGHFLNQFSVLVAGTGLAVIFFVLCKLVCTGTPLSIKLLNTGLGLGLFWLAWAVNGLRDTVLYISKDSNKLKLKEEEIFEKLEKNMNEILFRVMTLVAIAVLRLA